MENQSLPSIKISEFENIANNYNKNQLIQIKEEIINNFQDKLQCQKIIDKITSIISTIQEIFKEKINKTIETYESLLRRDEQSLRILYKNLLTYKLLKDSLDNRIRLLLIKEKEYELIKDKTGAFVRNGEIVYNKQKDNEIIILRTENSNLKNIIENYEKIIYEKDLLYENIKSKYNNIQNKFNKNKAQKLSIPNININLNDSPSVANIDNNACQYSLNLNNFKKPWNYSDKKNGSNFNYLKYKNISKSNKNIPFNYSLSSKNFFQNSVFDLSPKDIFGIKTNNPKSKSNEKLKKFRYDKQKDICSLKKRHFRMGDAFHNHFKKKQFNLLQTYTANSTKSINQSSAFKKISAYSNEIKISSYHNKNNYSQKLNYSNSKKDYSHKKNSRVSVESAKMHKSYLYSIPYNKEKDKCKYVKKDKNGNKYQLIYCRTKRENNSKNLYNKKNQYKKINNIDINKIFLPSSLKKNGIKLKK